MPHRQSFRSQLNEGLAKANELDLSRAYIAKAAGLCSKSLDSLLRGGNVCISTADAFLSMLEGLTPPLKGLDEAALKAGTRKDLSNYLDQQKALNYGKTPHRSR